VVAIVLAAVAAFVGIARATSRGQDAGVTEIETPIHLVLELHEHIGADDRRRLEIAAADSIGGIMDVAGADVLRRLRIGAERARERVVAGHALWPMTLARGDALLDPVDEGGKVGAVARPWPDIAEAGIGAEDARGNAAMADAGRVEQAIEACTPSKPGSS
jgi:hypothetical protein